MALTVETGAGVAGADSYATSAYIDAYWLARPHLALAATWAAGSTNKDGAAREATAYIDATWGPYFKGVRRGYVQGLLFPRTGAEDEAGYPLPDLPACLPMAVAELAARALSAPLAADDTETGIKRERQTVGPITKEVEYADGAVHRANYGAVADLLAPVLNGRQPNAPLQGWAWR